MKSKIAGLATTLATALFLFGCATKKETPQPNPAAAPQNLEAVFIDEPAAKKFPNPLAAISKLLPKKKSPPPPAASPVDWAGEIRMVNVAESFVLVESSSAAAAVAGEKYTAIREGRETGVVRMSSLRNPPFLIADIVSGSPSPGDKIHLPRPTVPPPDSQKPNATPQTTRPPAEADSAKPTAPNPLSRLLAPLREILPKPRPSP